MSDLDQLSFEERFGLLVDRELTERAHRRLQSRLQKAKLRQAACLEDIDYRHPRGLDKTLLQHLLSGRWLNEHLNCLIPGPTGVGKTWLACALAHQACRLSETLEPEQNPPGGKRALRRQQAPSIHRLMGWPNTADSDAQSLCAVPPPRPQKPGKFAAVVSIGRLRRTCLPR